MFFYGKLKPKKKKKKKPLIKPNELARMGGSLLSKAEVPGSNLLGQLPKEFSFPLTCA